MSDQSSTNSKADDEKILQIFPLTTKLKCIKCGEMALGWNDMGKKSKEDESVLCWICSIKMGLKANGKK